jgi:16S rRNA (uracil1498-N3)-methyltransferase
MRLTRLFVDLPLKPGALISLPKDTAQHIVKVLRARAGDAVVLFNGGGEDFEGALETVRGNQVTVALSAARAVHSESPLSLTLLQSVARGEKMDWIVQKATELGVARIVPVLSQRSVVRLDAAASGAKQKHWQAVAVSAAEQCQRARIPVVEAPRQLLNYLGELPAGDELRLLLWPGAAAPWPGGTVNGAILAVGPEGGFAAEELAGFELAGFRPLSLGPRILRTETAALAALCFMQTRFGDFDLPLT